MNSRIDNNYLKFVDEVQDRGTITMGENYEGDRSPTMVFSPTRAINQPMAFAPKPDLSPSNDKQDVNMIRLMCMFEVQKTEIDQLKKKMTQMEVDMNVQHIVATQEMASIREKCEHSQHRPKVVEDISPKNDQLKNLGHFQTAWNTVFKENAFLKNENNVLRNEINGLKLMLENSTVQSSMESNRSDLITDESDAFTEEGKEANLCSEKLTDSCVVPLAGVDEEQQHIAAVVDTVVKDTVANETCKIIESTEDSDTNGFVSPNTASFDLEVDSLTRLDSSKTDVTVTEVEDSSTSLGKHEKLETVHVTEVVKAPVDNAKKNHDAIALKLESNPVNVLNRLCMSRRWALPFYDFFESGEKYKPIFTVHCTLLTYRFQAEASSKREGKRLAAIGMYHIVKPIVTEDVRLANTLEVPENNTRSAGVTFVDARVSSSAKSHEKPLVIANVVGAPAAAVHSGNDDSTVADENVSARKNTLTEVVDDSPSLLTQKDEATDLADSDGNVLVNVEDEPRQSLSPERAELVDRLRLSNNPAIQKLKAIDSLNEITAVQCYIGFLGQIADEEQLPLLYDTCSTAVKHRKIQQNLETIELTISPLPAPVIGHGETVFDAQLDAAYVCLTRLKLMLKG